MAEQHRRKALNFEKRTDEPVVLEINGDEVTAVDGVDGLAMLEYTAVMRDPDQVSMRVPATVRWLKTCFGVEQGEETSELYKEFQRVVGKHGIGIEGLGEIAGVLADMYATRPTESDDTSTSGQSTTGDGSPESSPFAASPGKG